MELLYQDHLFAKGLFVSEAGPSSHASEAVLSLAKLFNIEIVEHPEWADLPMVRLAQRNIGINVPEPFYRGFPKSVFELTPAELAIDQFLHHGADLGALHRIDGIPFPGAVLEHVQRGRPRIADGGQDPADVVGAVEGDQEDGLIHGPYSH